MNETMSGTVSCHTCAAACCRYVATEIDKPTTRQERDHIRWYLLHRNVNVFIDHDGLWFLEFETDCTALRDDHTCGAYEQRPLICRGHGEDGDDCEHHGEEEPYAIRFSHVEEFDDFLERKRRARGARD